MCFMQQGIKFTEVRNMMWFFTGTLILSPHTQTHKHTNTHSTLRVSRLTHPYKYYLHNLLCAHSSYLYYITLNDSMNNSTISKIYFPQCLFFSKIINLQMLFVNEML